MGCSKAIYLHAVYKRNNITFNNTESTRPTINAKQNVFFFNYFAREEETALPLSVHFVVS